MQYNLLIISILMGCSSTVIFKFVGSKYTMDKAQVNLFNGMCALFAAVALILLNGAVRIPSNFTVVIGILFGILIMVTQLSSFYALRMGSMSYTVFIGSCGMIIPTIVGTVVWSESVNIFQIIGMIVLIISIFFGINPKKNQKVTVNWIVLIMINFISSGLVGVLQKIHQTSAFKSESNDLIITAFFVMAVCCFVIGTTQKNKDEKRQMNFKEIVLFPLLVGVFSAGINVINLYLSGVMASIIFYPIVNGGQIISAGLLATFMFKEKLSVLQYAGLISGIISILLIGNIMNNFLC